MSKTSKKVQQRRREAREKLIAAGCLVYSGNHVRHVESRQTFTWRKGLINGLQVDAFIAWILLDPPQRNGNTFMGAFTAAVQAMDRTRRTGAKR